MNINNKIFDILHFYFPYGLENISYSVGYGKRQILVYISNPQYINRELLDFIIIIYTTKQKLLSADDNQLLNFIKNSKIVHQYKDNSFVGLTYKEYTSSHIKKLVATVLKE